jgi:glycine/D-amino acid oxidase-like deaminating enzyme
VNKAISVATRRAYGEAITPSEKSPADGPHRSRSLWLDQVAESLAPQDPLTGDATCDVAIVGGGFTGLWTAYALAIADPGLRVSVLEAETCGFGASGRNGGWASALFAGARSVTAKRRGREGVLALHREMVAAIDDIERTCTTEGIDCAFTRGGTMTLATSPAHVSRLREHVEADHRWGLDEHDSTWLDANEAQRRIGAARVFGAAFTPHCAAIQPARLARGLAHAVRRRGVEVHEATRVRSIEPGTVVTDGGTVRAPIVVRATEGYTPQLPRLHRRLIPIYSFIVATEPLPSSFWDEAGWRNREPVSDGRHLIIYAQRTADDRIAFGGRGAPYHFGSRVQQGFDRDPAVFAELTRVLHDLFPATRDARITHRWGGPLGVPRDWYPSVGIDRTTGIAWAGGYVGDGVTTTNLAGRTLADLIVRRETERTDLAWVDHRNRDWEPEPLRWLGVNAGLRLSATADRREARTGQRATRLERLLALVTG